MTFPFWHAAVQHWHHRCSAFPLIFVSSAHVGSVCLCACRLAALIHVHHPWRRSKPVPKSLRRISLSSLSLARFLSVSLSSLPISTFWLGRSCGTSLWGCQKFMHLLRWLSVFHSALGNWNNCIFRFFAVSKKIESLAYLNKTLISRDCDNRGFTSQPHYLLSFSTSVMWCEMMKVIFIRWNQKLCVSMCRWKQLCPMSLRPSVLLMLLFLSNPERWAVCVHWATVTIWAALSCKT